MKHESTTTHQNPDDSGWVVGTVQNDYFEGLSGAHYTKCVKMSNREKKCITCKVHYIKE